MSLFSQGLGVCSSANYGYQFKAPAYDPRNLSNKGYYLPHPLAYHKGGSLQVLI